MGTTFFNLYTHVDQQERLAGLLKPGDMIHTGYGDWLMVCADSGKPSRLATAARKLTAPALMFLYVDDDEFSLMLYREGKKAAELNSAGYQSRLKAFTEILPEDGDALKKLRTIPYCLSLSEMIDLLEETFGLPFYAPPDDEDIPPVKKSDQTYKLVKARQKELKRRPNAFDLVPVDRTEWPESAAVKMETIEIAQKWSGPFCLSELLHSIGNRRFLSLDEGRLSVTVAVNINSRDSGYDTILHHRLHDTDMEAMFPPYNTFQGAVRTPAGHYICQSVDRESGFPVSCLDIHGNEVWKCQVPGSGFPIRWAGDDSGRPLFVLSPGNEICLLDMESGHFAARHSFPEGSVKGVNWNEASRQWIIELGNPGKLVLLDEGLREVCSRQMPMPLHRIPCEAPSLYYGMDFRNHGLRRFDLNTGTEDSVSFELPGLLPACVTPRGNIIAIPAKALPTNLYVLSDTGRVISRHPLPGMPLNAWTEGGHTYIAVMASDNPLPFWMTDITADVVQVWELVDR